MSWKRRCVGMLVLLGLAFASGCVSSDRGFRVASYRPRNLIFNPTQTAALPGLYARSDWPSASNGQAFEETIEYRETINDLQGLTSDSRDYLTRRFYSVRTGRTRR